MKRRIRLASGALALSVFIQSTLGLAVEAEKAESDTEGQSWYAPERADGDGPRSVLWHPLVSFILPGFDQYAVGHTTSALAYSSIWLASSVWSIDRSHKWDDIKDSDGYKGLSREDKEEYQLKNETGRQALLAGQLAQDVGFLSAFHSFRTSATTQQADGHYEFLKKENEETVPDLLLAPFQFSHLQKQTTWIPLGVLAAIAALGANNLADDRQRRAYTSGDAMYTGAVSYNAGVSEEALFRGYLQPVMYENWRSSGWANVAQSALFGAAHLGSNSTPIAQLGLGFYLGWLNEQNNWTLSEGIFIHAWWDVIALTSTYLEKRKTDKSMVLWLPAFRTAF